ncbi:mandelate racemase/muconate lactonizing enzyme family protein [Ramlibacter sp. USB13]|uniref:Mandelate racemase/muconate lactonizing enzyme family protein n=1 Tax=Ramlibacter cellulosilyticus TaxID=2764187 RepID=A0A923SBV7_9BURK|nr:mandelate racemase/muconate lactonizing enzyme family protein [Ramlibacter cellulosilyticus]MBC5784254.1 mandelate racemase/muconate lactonizing enzyme family protein [Ramlibacter cellulosilyticus]
MKIASVRATPLNLPITMGTGARAKSTSLSLCLVDVELDDGRVGTGMTAITEEEVIASVVNDVAGHALVGMDPLRHEQIWDRLYWLLTPRGQSGYASHAIAAIDLALWDLKGQILGQPVWKLFGGARAQVPVYATFGFAFFDREELAAAAKSWVERGFKRLKMTVGHHALQRRDEPRPLAEVIAEDVKRIEAVRSAVGPDVQIFIDANCSLDYFHASALAQRIEDLGIAFFEEPVSQNDIPNMVKLRQKTRIPLAAGQNEGLASRFRDMLAAQAVDVVQPNACITGGYTQCLRIAGMAAAFNAQFANGGAWPHHNMHLHAGLANGSLVEYHSVAVEVCKQVFDGLPEPTHGMLALPDTPGLGFKPNRERVAELAKRPGSRGVGKA